jgi:hypothetical protein
MQLTSYVTTFLHFLVCGGIDQHARKDVFGFNAKQYSDQIDAMTVDSFCAMLDAAHGGMQLPVQVFMLYDECHYAQGSPYFQHLLGTNPVEALDLEKFKKKRYPVGNAFQRAELHATLLTYILRGLTPIYEERPYASTLS